MHTTIYQAFIPRYATVFTAIEYCQDLEGTTSIEIVSLEEVQEMDKKELVNLVNELLTEENKKASYEM